MGIGGMSGRQLGGVKLREYEVLSTDGLFSIDPALQCWILVCGKTSRRYDGMKV